MRAQIGAGPWWALLLVWGVVNAINLLQGAGFISRVTTRSRSLNHILGYAILALGVPGAVALVALMRSGAPFLHWAGAVVFLAFLVLMLAVDYLWPVEFRSPARPALLVPYLLLFFGAILLMGLPMFNLSRPLWLVTALTTVFLLAAMIVAQRAGVG